MEWSDEDIVAVSALSHLLYCERQMALIHVEGVFLDNSLTVGGNIGHERVDRERSVYRSGCRIETSLPVFSDRLGIRGVADLVEFPAEGPPLPIDYKHGRIGKWLPAEVQVCALALCLEEMLDCAIPTGAIYHIRSRRRREFDLHQSLRNMTTDAILRTREIISQGDLPAPIFDKKCKRCSLITVCQPNISARNPLPIFARAELEP